MDEAETKDEETSGFDRLPLTPEEEKVIDDAIRIMAKIYSRQGYPHPDRHSINSDSNVYEPIDKLITETLTSLKKDIPDKPAEKLFDRIGSTIQDYGGEYRDAISVVYVRFMDTMECITEVKGEYRGRKTRSMKYTKEDAFRRLQERGLTRR